MNLDETKVKLRSYFNEACKVLNVNYEAIDFAYEGIGNRFKRNDVTCETAENTLYVNTEWIKMLPADDDYDMQYQMYHEARHFYQHNAIADYNARGKTSELPSTIKKWEHESCNYIPNEGTKEERKAYAAQDVEIDANAFANAMLLAKGYNYTKAPEEQKEETDVRTLTIFTNFDRLGKWKNRINE